MRRDWSSCVECDQRPQQARGKLEAVVGPPTFVVESGGVWIDRATGEIQSRVHLYWRLKRPATGEDLAKLKRARRLATQYAGRDPTNISCVHPLRWPGSWNRKAEPRIAQIVVLDDDHEIDLDEALTKLRAVQPEKPEKETNEGNEAPTSDEGNAGVGYNEDADRDVRPTAELLANIASERSCTLRLSRSQPG